ncbi:MAG: hypothetical protein R2883_00290 [Caldisericia bacterium]
MKSYNPETGEEMSTDLSFEGEADEKQEGLKQEGTDKEIMNRLFDSSDTSTN